MSIETAFLSFLRRKGKNVTILHRAPKTVDGIIQKDNDSNIIYEETEIQTKCRLIDKRDYEQTELGGIKLSSKYKIGLFKKADARAGYLSKKNTVQYIDPDTGETVNFEIKSVTSTEGHIEVVLD